MSNEASLYDRLGGRDAIEAVVDRFYDRVLDDERLEPYFENTNVERLRSHQTQFLVAATGGPADYSGADMRSAHEHLDITNEHFNAVSIHLMRTLEEFDVGDKEIGEVLITVGGLKADVLAQ